MFQGEMMHCVMCGKEQQSDPRVESNWRLIAIEGKPMYVCPDHFPPDGASVEAFREAYLEVINRCLEIVSGKQ